MALEELEAEIYSCTGDTRISREIIALAKALQTTITKKVIKLAKDLKEYEDEYEELYEETREIFTNLAKILRSYPPKIVEKVLSFFEQIIENDDVGNAPSVISVLTKLCSNSRIAKILREAPDHWIDDLLGVARYYWHSIRYSKDPNEGVKILESYWSLREILEDEEMGDLIELIFLETKDTEACRETYELLREVPPDERKKLMYDFECIAKRSESGYLIKLYANTLRKYIPFPTLLWLISSIIMDECIEDVYNILGECEGCILHESYLEALARLYSSPTVYQILKKAHSIDQELAEYVAEFVCRCYKRGVLRKRIVRSFPNL